MCRQTEDSGPGHVTFCGPMFVVVLRFGRKIDAATAVTLDSLGQLSRRGLMFHTDGGSNWTALEGIWASEKDGCQPWAAAVDTGQSGMTTEKGQTGVGPRRVGLTCENMSTDEGIRTPIVGWGNVCQWVWTKCSPIWPSNMAMPLCCPTPPCERVKECALQYLNAWLITELRMWLTMETGYCEIHAPLN